MTTIVESHYSVAGICLAWLLFVIGRYVFNMSKSNKHLDAKVPYRLYWDDISYVNQWWIHRARPPMSPWAVRCWALFYSVQPCICRASLCAPTGAVRAETACPKTYELFFEF